MSSRSLIKILIPVLVLILVLVGIKLTSVYKLIYGRSIHTSDQKALYLYIPSGSDYEDVVAILEENHLITNRKTFDWAASKKKYPGNIHPGRYRIRNNMSNNQLLNMLRSGLQEPVNLIINMARTPEELAGKIADQIEADHSELLKLMQDETFLKSYGFDRYTIMGMFIPNTYEFWWNTNAEGFLKRMYKEYNKFWNRERMGSAKEINFTPNEVITLASIIINETNKEDEYRRIAGVYINRLNQGIRLQADPTIKYALGDFERQRILKADTYVDSPYNTYMHAGLPPGPIAIPGIRAVDAVLHYEKHDYIFFCAREDFSGYHNFARTLEQHNKNAHSYQKALNRRNILR
jgi:UPF0755 protein